MHTLTHKRSIHVTVFWHAFVHDIVEYFCCMLPSAAWLLQVPFDSLGAVYTVLNKYNARQPTEDYLASGKVEINAEVAEAVVSDIQRDMLNATSGAVKPRVV